MFQGFAVTCIIRVRFETPAYMLESGSFVHRVCLLAHPRHPPIYQFLVLTPQFTRTIFCHIQLQI
jgi:hypothetical protein